MNKMKTKSGDGHILNRNRAKFNLLISDWDKHGRFIRVYKSDSSE